MASIRSTERSSPLVNRLDDVQMRARNREHAKVMMRQAEAFAEVVAGIHERVCDTAGGALTVFAWRRARRVLDRDQGSAVELSSAALPMDRHQVDRVTPATSHG